MKSFKIGHRVDFNPSMDSELQDNIREYLGSFCKGRFSIEYSDGRMSVNFSHMDDVALALTTFDDIINHSEPVYT